MMMRKVQPLTMNESLDVDHFKVDEEDEDEEVSTHSFSSI